MVWADGATYNHIMHSNKEKKAHLLQEMRVFIIFLAFILLLYKYIRKRCVVYVLLNYHKPGVNGKYMKKKKKQKEKKKIKLNEVTFILYKFLC